MSERGGDANEPAAAGPDGTDYPPAPQLYPGYGSAGQPVQVPPPPGYGPPAGGSHQPPPGYYQPGQPSYGYGRPPTVQGDGLGVAAMVLGIVGVVTSFIVIGMVPSILAIIFGVIGRKRAMRGTARNGGQALAGLITGIVGVVISLGMIAVFTVAAVEISNCEQNAQTQQEFDNCSN